MKIYIGCDHRGIEIENEIKEYLFGMGFDVNTSKLVHNDTDDYCDFAFELGNNIVKDQGSIGILLCGTGIGMSIAANKVKGIRAAKCNDTEEAYYARVHNDANVLCLGINNKKSDELIKIIDTFINTKSPSEERHINRVNKIINYENGTYYEL